MTTQMFASSPLVVVHIISGLGQGGAETVLYRLVTAATPQTRHIVVSMSDAGVFGFRLQQANIEVHCLHMKGLGVLTGWLALRRLLKKIQPDVVQTWMYHADLLGGLAARSVGIKNIAWGIRNSGENLHHSSLKARVVAMVSAKLSGWLPKQIVACAENAARRHKQWGYNADKMVVIPNGYDLTQWQPQPEQAGLFRSQLGLSATTPLIVSVGRWNPLKDHPNLLSALAKLKRVDTNWFCVLVGDGIEQTNEELMRLIKQEGLEERIALLGRRDDVPVIMSAADIHVLSSKAEGFPNVVCEAMVSRALCVVTDVGDAARIVGEEGIVVTPRNAQALAVGMEKALCLLKSPMLSEQLDNASNSVAQRYSLESMVRNYEQLWHQMTTTSTVMSTTETTQNQAPVLLYVVNNPAFFISHRLPLALAAKQAGFEVQVATMAGSAVARIRQLGFTHHKLPLSRSGKNPLAELRSLWAMYRLFKTVRPQVVHAVTIKPVLYGGIAARLARVPGFLAAVSGLGYIFTGERAGLMRWVALRLYSQAFKHPHSRVIFQNTNDKTVLLKAGVVRAEQAVLIRGSGVDLHAFNFVPEYSGPPVALMVARLLVDKGINEFIQAAQYSQQQQANIVWQVAGSPDKGNPASVTAEQMTAWHQSGVIQWLGEQSNIAELYHKAHIAVLPSYREGLPKSLIEAAACGRAVVTTDVPGCRDAIEENVTGLLVPPQDALALYKATLHLAEDEALRQQYGKAGRELAEREFDINSVIETHLQLYRYLAK